MPDILSVLRRRWQFIFGLPLAVTLLSFVACQLVTKQYAGVVTALPANSATADRARIFNPNIEALYPEIGSADELDKIEGTAKLDTLYLATAKAFSLINHYGIDAKDNNALYLAALRLKQNTNISRTGFGELRIKVWDKSNAMAASLANAFLEKINAIHQQLRSENNQLVLQKLKEEYTRRQQLVEQPKTTTSESQSPVALQTQLTQYEQLIGEYELALQTTPRALLVVEKARPLPWADRPKTTQTVMLAFGASLLFSFLLALFIESRKLHS